MQKLVIIGSNSIHTKRFIAGILNLNLYQVLIITNLTMEEFSGTRQISLNFSLRNLCAARQIFQELHHFKPNIIHVHQANSYAWHALHAIKKLKLKPLVVLTTWGSDILMLPNQNRILARMVKYNLKNSDIVTTDSLFMASQIQKILAKESRHVYVINFGVQDLPAMLDLNQKQKIILSCRLHKKFYQIDKIILAFNHLVKNKLIDVEYQLIIAASGEEMQNLQNLVRNYHLESRVIFTGMLNYSELINWYTKAKIFVSVPVSDGTASSLLESLSYGLIPVLSNLPANLEWVIDKLNGFIASNLNILAYQLLKAVNVAEDYHKHQEFYQFNYQLIKAKANFNVNLIEFTKLYESAH